MGGDLVIHAIAELGRWHLKQEKKDPIDILTQPVSPEAYPHLLVIHVKADSVTMHLEEHSFEKEKFLLYRGGTGGNSANFSPVALITEYEKTFRVKILRWFESVRKQNKNLPADVMTYIEQIYQQVISHQESILTWTAQKAAELKGGMVYVVMVEDHYPREIPAFVQAFQTLTEQAFQKNTIQNQVCSVCGEQKSLILAGTDVFKFYTTDKPGFISGGFEEGRSWRNYPICPDCNLYLQEGRKILEKRLSFRFLGLPYLLVPEYLLPNSKSQDEVMNILFNQDKKQSLESDKAKNYLSNEQEILDELQDFSDHLMYHLLFVKKSNSAERIQLLLDDILPSQLRKLFEAKQSVEYRFPKSSDDDDYHKFHFGRIRPFFFKSDPNKRKTDLDAYFLQVVASVFHRKQIAPSFLCSFFIKELRRLFLDESIDFFYMTRNAMMSMEFFYELDLINKREGYRLDSKFTPFFANYLYYDHPVKQGLFLLGALTQNLLNLQQIVRQSQPFAKQLKSLKMTEADFRDLFAKAIDKFDQYSYSEHYAKFAKSRNVLQAEITKLLGAVPHNWEFSTSELNYCFATGKSVAFDVNQFINQTLGGKSGE
jgi:CRISPR-associated protein Csh1